ncbi:hypothetical protein GGH93_004180 [Coemansia aciculifera]|nr:hypothetical protein GGH93_004180 [Coemansia aciculifera]
MRTLSLLQILPSHVVELIVNHVAGSSRLRFDNVTESSEGYAVLLMPLLSVCQDFRAAALARFCKTYTLDLTCFSDQGNDKMALWPERLRGIVFPTHLYAQELNITLGVFSVYNGTALKELLREPHGDFLFPMARSLKVTLTQTTREQRLLVSIPAAQDIEPNIRAFVQRIRLMAPTTRKVCISLESRSTNESQFVVQHFSSLVAQLHRLGNTVEHNYNCRPMRLEPPPTDISSLAYISWSENNGDLLMQLALHNAPTLRTLDISLEEAESISQLIQNVDGSYIQYPCLRELKLYQRWGWHWDEDREEMQRQQPLPVFPGVIPFPHLRHLSFTSRYPFGDDTPFRGNADALEHLHLDLCPRVVRVLRECQVFTHNSHPRLQCVRLGLSSSHPQDLFDTDVSFTKFVLSVGPSACIRHVDQDAYGSEFRFASLAFDGYSFIRMLSLTYMPMHLRDVIALVKVLPLLTDLCTRFSKLEAWSSGISDQNLPAHVIANYAPMGERFRCWRFAELDDADVKTAVKCVLLLALVCPNFDYAAVSVDSRELFMAYLKKTISKTLAAFSASERIYENSFDTDISIDMDKYNMAKACGQLLWVSECWWIAAIKIVCDNCEIDFESSPKGFDVRYPAFPPNFGFAQYHMEKMVKRVAVHAPSWSDIGGGKLGSTPP